MQWHGTWVFLSELSCGYLKGFGGVVGEPRALAALQRHGPRVRPALHSRSTT